MYFYLERDQERWKSGSALVSDAPRPGCHSIGGTGGGGSLERLVTSLKLGSVGRRRRVERCVSLFSGLRGEGERGEVASTGSAEVGREGRGGYGRAREGGSNRLTAGEAGVRGLGGRYGMCGRGCLTVVGDSSRSGHSAFVASMSALRTTHTVVLMLRLGLWNDFFLTGSAGRDCRIAVTTLCDSSELGVVEMLRFKDGREPHSRYPVLSSVLGSLRPAVSQVRSESGGGHAKSWIWSRKSSYLANRSAMSSVTLETEVTVLSLTPGLCRFSYHVSQHTAQSALRSIGPAAVKCGIASA